MDLRVAKLRSVVDALRTEMEALAVQQSALQTRATGLQARIVTVEEYRAARSSEWGSELPYSLLGEVFNLVGWGGPECAAMRLVSVGWCSAHDSMCRKLRIRSWSNWPGWAAGTLLERVTTVDLRKVWGYNARDGRATCLSRLKSLPSLTSLELCLSDVLSKVEAKALGGLTTLTSLTLVRNLEHTLKFDESHCEDLIECRDGYESWEMDEYGCGCGHCGADQEDYLEDLMDEQAMQLRSYAGRDHWAEALSPLTALTHLDLSKCQNVTANTLGPLSKLTALTSLELGDGVGFRVLVGVDFERLHHTITNEAIRAVASVSSLMALKLTACGMTDKGLAKLARLPALTSLHLTECYKVTATAVQALQAAIPGLVVV